MLYRVRVIQTAINCETLQENVEHVLPQRDCRNKLLGNYVVGLFFFNSLYVFSYTYKTFILSFFTFNELLVSRNKCASLHFWRDTLEITRSSPEIALVLETRGPFCWNQWDYTSNTDDLVMEARAAKCCLHTSQRGPPEPTDGLNHANKDRTFGSVCWCQHGPPATSAVAVSPASSERIRLLTELRRLSAAAQDRLYYPVYITGQEVRTIWRKGYEKPEKALFCRCTWLN